MKNLIVILLILSSISCFSQTIDETVEYINTQIIESTKSVSQYAFIDQITLSADGKITIDNYLHQPGNPSVFESRSCYIKQLTFDKFKGVALPD